MDYFGDFVIPCCNGGSDEEFNFRLRNIESICNLLPISMNIIVVEQLLKDNTQSFVDTLKDKIKHRTDINFIKKDFKKYFVKGWLNNIGYKNMKTDKLFLGESDVIFAPDYWVDMFDRIQKRDQPWGFCWDKLLYLDKNGTKIIKKLVNGPGKPEGGIVYFNKNFYRDIGGSSEWMINLGGMDNDLAKRSTHLTKKRIINPGIIYHLWHPISTMKGTRPESNTEERQSRRKNTNMVRSIYANTKLTIKKLNELINDMGGEIPLCESVDLFNENGLLNVEGAQISSTNYHRPQKVLKKKEEKITKKIPPNVFKKQDIVNRKMEQPKPEKRAINQMSTKKVLNKER